MPPFVRSTLPRWVVLAGGLLAAGCSGDAGPQTAVDAQLPGREDRAAVLVEDAGADAAGDAAGDAAEDAAELDRGADQAAPPPPATPTTVELITYNWPGASQYPGSDAQQMAYLTARASVIGLQEAGWLPGRQALLPAGWERYQPDPPADGDPGPVAQPVLWKAAVWQKTGQGTHLLSLETTIQPEAAGPTNHRTKHLVWVQLKHRTTGEVWTFGNCHFVPSKHLGGAALALWKKQRDNLLQWWAGRGGNVVVTGDFNAEPQDAVAQPFWGVARHQSAPSHGARSIDWIVRKKHLRALEHRALLNHDTSDHRPVWGKVGS